MYILPHIYRTDCFNKRQSRVKRCCVVIPATHACSLVRVTVSQMLWILAAVKPVTVYKYTQTRVLRSMRAVAVVCSLPDETVERSVLQVMSVNGTMF
jgi:hypothetical protein